MSMSSPVKRAHSPDRPSVLRCAAGLLAADLALNLLGFRRTLRLYQWLGRDRSDGSTFDAELTDACATAVAAAAAFYPRRAICLEQSLVLYRMLRRRRQPARLRVGARPMPFAAHAWVECAGAPVNELPERLDQLVPFPIVGG